MNIDWHNIHKFHGKVIVIADEGRAFIELEDVDKEVIVNCDTYVTYNIKSDMFNKNTVQDLITKYYIKEKYVDQNKNLILIADSEFVNL
ncbi:hypothetical protein ABFV99_00530 [Cytobacillus horneckiae]|uniref:hypothetical protein n=1 Tax=Cytobacillus horneckiae TaxID=549687 RepID=UPI0034CF1946